MIEGIFLVIGVVLGTVLTWIKEHLGHHRETLEERRDRVQSVCVELLADVDELHRNYPRPLSSSMKALARAAGVASDMKLDPWESVERRVELNIQRLEIIQPELVSPAKILLSASLRQGRISHGVAIKKFASAVRKATKIA